MNSNEKEYVGPIDGSHDPNGPCIVLPRPGTEVHAWPLYGVTLDMGIPHLEARRAQRPQHETLEVLARLVAVARDLDGQIAGPLAMDPVKLAKALDLSGDRASDLCEAIAAIRRFEEVGGMFAVSLRPGNKGASDAIDPNGAER